MKWTFKSDLLVFCFLSIICTSSIYCQVELFNNQMDLLQQTYVKNGSVDYLGIKNDKELVLLIKSSFYDVNLEQLSDIQQISFYINAYNFWVIDKTLEYYPTNSVMEITGFFETPNIPWNDRLYSLNEFEQELFIKFPNEPRLHFVLVCAAKGCPDLSNRAFTLDNYKTKIKYRTQIALQDEKMVQLDMHEKKAYVSKIFKWYRSDFTKELPLRGYLNKYLDKKIPEGFSIHFQDYDWDLNDL